jgi:hypothetical protein
MPLGSNIWELCYSIRIFGKASSPTSPSQTSAHWLSTQTPNAASPRPTSLSLRRQQATTFSPVPLFENNRVDSMYLMLSHLAQLASTPADVSCETSRPVPEFPTIRPADVAIRIFPGALSQPIPQSDDPFLASFVKHDELGENKKSLGRPSTTRRRHCRHPPPTILPRPLRCRPG